MKIQFIQNRRKVGGLKFAVVALVLISTVALAETPNVVRVAIKKTSDALWPGMDPQKVAVLQECFSHIYDEIGQVDNEWFAEKATLFLKSCNDLRSVETQQLEASLLSNSFISNSIVQFKNSPSEAEMKRLEQQRLAHISDVAAAIQEWIASTEIIVVLREDNSAFIEALRILSQLEVMGAMGQTLSQESAMQIADDLLEHTRRHLANSVRLAELNYKGNAYLHSHNVLNVDALRSSLATPLDRERYLADFFKGVDQKVIVLRQPYDMKQLFATVMAISSAAPDRDDVYSRVRERMGEMAEMYAMKPGKFTKVSKMTIDPVFLASKGGLGTFSSGPALPEGWEVEDRENKK